MSENKNVSVDSISVEAKLTHTGISAKATSRFVNAVDRLGGGLVDLIGIRLEGSNLKAQTKAKAQRDIIDAAKDQFIERMKIDPRLADRAIENHLEGIIRKTKNIDGVIDISLEEIQTLPPSQGEESNEDKLDVDWLNDFESFAGNANSESLKLLFGKILSGEVRRPGSFSRRTLRTAFEMDQYTSQLFVKFASLRAGKITPHVEERLTFEELLELEGAALINNMAQVTVKPTNEPFNSYLLGDSLALKFEFKDMNGAAVCPIIPYTLQGLELARLIVSDEIEALKKIGKLSVGNFSSISIHEFADESRKTIQTEPMLTVFSS